MYEPLLKISSNDALQIILKSKDPEKWMQDKKTRIDVIDNVIDYHEDLTLLYAKIGYRPFDHFDRITKEQLQSLINAIDTDGNINIIDFDDQEGFYDESNEFRVKVVTEGDRFIEQLDYFVDRFSLDAFDNNDPFRDEQINLINSIPADLRKKILCRSNAIKNKISINESITYEIQIFVNAVKEALGKMGDEKKKHVLDRILWQLIEIERIILDAAKELRSKNKFYDQEPQSPRKLCDVYHRTVYHRTGGYESISETIDDIIKEYLLSPWMHCPTLTKALIAYSIDLHIVPKRPTPYRNMLDTLYIVIMLFLIIAIAVSSLLSIPIITGASIGLTALLLGYPLSILMSNFSFYRYIKKCTPFFNVKAEVVEGNYDGHILAERLKKIEKEKIYPKTYLYLLLKLEPGGIKQ